MLRRLPRAVASLAAGAAACSAAAAARCASSPPPPAPPQATGASDRPQSPTTPTPQAQQAESMLPAPIMEMKKTIYGMRRCRELLGLSPRPVIPACRDCSHRLRDQAICGALERKAASRRPESDQRQGEFESAYSVSTSKREAVLLHLD